MIGKVAPRFSRKDILTMKDRYENLEIQIKTLEKTQRFPNWLIIFKNRYCVLLFLQLIR